MCFDSRTVDVFIYVLGTKVQVQQDALNVCEERYKLAVSMTNRAVEIINEHNQKIITQERYIKLLEAQNAEYKHRVRRSKFRRVLVSTGLVVLGGAIVYVKH